jgi:tRNA(adenine34) deaminase
MALPRGAPHVIILRVEDEAYMREALAEAERAYQKGEIPVGAVAVKDGVIIGRGHNQKEELKDPTAHAEMTALRQAGQALGGWRLTGVTIYSTLEPCPMCAGALVMARAERLVYAAPDPKNGACGSVFDIVRLPKWTHHLEVEGGVLAEEAGVLLERFFSQRR